MPRDNGKTNEQCIPRVSRVTKGPGERDMDQEQSQSTLTDSLEQAEGLILQEQDDAARELLARLAEDAEEYVDRNCAATESDQWFSFPTIFDRLCYRRVERDPRTLHDVGEPWTASMRTSRLRACAPATTTLASRRSSRRCAGTP